MKHIIVYPITCLAILLAPAVPASTTINISPELKAAISQKGFTGFTYIWLNKDGSHGQSSQCSNLESIIINSDQIEEFCAATGDCKTSPGGYQRYRKQYVTWGTTGCCCLSPVPTQLNSSNVIYQQGPPGLKFKQSK